MAYQQSSRDPSSWDHSCRDLCRGRKCHAHCTGLGTGLLPAHSLDHPSQGCKGILHLHRPHGWNRWDPSNQLKKKTKRTSIDHSWEWAMRHHLPAEEASDSLILILLGANGAAQVILTWSLEEQPIKNSRIFMCPNTESPT